MKSYVDVCTESKLILDFSKSNNNIFSIVIPAYRRSDVIRDVLTSIKKQDTVDIDYDIIIVDDSGNYPNPSPIKDVIREFSDLPLKYYVNSANVGFASNWNKCINASCCEWAFMLHQDDLLLPGAIQHIHTLISEYGTKYDCLFIGRKNILYDGNENIEHLLYNIENKKIRVKKYRKKDLLFGTVACAPSGMLIKRQMFLQQNGFSNVAKWYATDVDFISRLVDHRISIGKSNAVFILKREGGNNTATSSKTYMVSWVSSEYDILNKYISSGSHFDQYLLRERMFYIAKWAGIKLEDLEINLLSKKSDGIYLLLYRVLRKLYCIYRDICG